LPHRPQQRVVTVDVSPRRGGGKVRSKSAGKDSLTSLGVKKSFRGTIHIFHPFRKEGGKERGLAAGPYFFNSSRKKKNLLLREDTVSLKLFSQGLPFMRRASLCDDRDKKERLPAGGWINELGKKKELEEGTAGPRVHLVARKGRRGGCVSEDRTLTPSRQEERRRSQNRGERGESCL